MQSTSDEVKQILTAKTDEVLAEGSFGLPWYVGEYLDLGKAWQQADHRKLQMSKEKKSAIGALITLLKSQII